MPGLSFDPAQNTPINKISPPWLCTWKCPICKIPRVTTSEDLKWSKHINNITKKANQTLGFLKRYIRVHNIDLKSTAYKTLVRPQLEYASTVWSPHTDLDINNFESLQRRAARWVTRDYQYTSSVLTMLRDLNWSTLNQRRIVFDWSSYTRSHTTLWPFLPLTIWCGTPTPFQEITRWHTDRSQL